MGLNREQLAAWVAASCAAQGLPVQMTDPATVNQVRVLMGGGSTGARAHARSASTNPAGGRLHLPAGIDSAGVEGARSERAGLDDGVIEDRADDRGLPRQVQSGPLSA
jgi:hypothetical protein